MGRGAENLYRRIISKNMKILIDMTFVSPKSMHQSLPIAVMRMLGGVPKEERRKLKLLFDTGCADMLHEMFPDYEYMTVNVYNIRKLYYDPRLFFVPFFMERAINHSGCDAVFFTTDGSLYVKHRLKIPSIVEINDMKWLKDGTNADKMSFRSIVLRMFRGDNHKKYKKTIERAELITTISQYTKEDLLRLFPETPAEKVHVIYLSVPEIKGSKKPVRLFGDEHFILNINAIQPFKNPITLIKAFALLANQYKGKLVIVGRTTEYWETVLEPYIKENHLENKVLHLQNLDETELRYLYEHADLFVTPSLREGFGFTPIEAAIYRCPVISSKSESLPEATMGLVKYYEPATDEHALHEAMAEILKNPPSEEKRKEISKTFLERYTACNHANNLLKLFSLIKEK